MPKTELFYRNYDQSYSVPNPASRKKKIVDEFFRFSPTVIAIKTMTNAETELFYPTYDPSYSVPNPAIRKKWNFEFNTVKIMLNKCSLEERNIFY